MVLLGLCFAGKRKGKEGGGEQTRQQTSSDEELTRKKEKEVTAEGRCEKIQGSEGLQEAEDRRGGREK